MRSAAALVLSLSAVGCAAAPPEVDSGENDSLARATDVQAALQASMDAWEHADVEAVVAGFTPDAVIYDPQPPGEWRGSDAVRAFTAELFEQNKEIAIDLDDVRVQTSGPVGWTTSRYVFSSTQGDERVTVEGFLTMIWVRQPDGSYRAALFHASRLPVAPGEAGA